MVEYAIVVAVVLLLLGVGRRRRQRRYRVPLVQQAGMFLAGYRHVLIGVTVDPACSDAEEAEMLVRREALRALQGAARRRGIRHEFLDPMPAFQLAMGNWEDGHLERLRLAERDYPTCGVHLHVYASERVELEISTPHMGRLVGCTTSLRRFRDGLAYRVIYVALGRAYGVATDLAAQQVSFPVGY